MDIQFIAVVDTLRIIALAVWGVWMCGQAGRYYADFKDKKAALFFGVGLLLIVVAVKSF